jgi:D-sedoheptulose 7-phosphate isomerase
MMPHDAELTADEYFRSLSDALQALEVTDETGARLSMDEGTGRVMAMLASVRAELRKVMVIGNGGSAAIATHVHNDLCKAVGVRALAFTDVPLLTALSNDCGYASVYRMPIELWADPNDLLIAISSSGRSENILKAAAAAMAHGCRVITMTGFGPENALRKAGTLNFYVRSQAYGYVELAHAALTHYLTDAAMALAGAVVSS